MHTTMVKKMKLKFWEKEKRYISRVDEIKEIIDTVRTKCEWEDAGVTPIY